jgi:hypothetical protein
VGGHHRVGHRLGHRLGGFDLALGLGHGHRGPVALVPAVVAPALGLGHGAGTTGQHDRTHHGDHEQTGGDLEREEVGGEDGFAQSGHVATGLTLSRPRHRGRPCRPVRPEGQDENPGQAEHHEGAGQRALQREWIHGQVLLLVHSEEHDHEEEEHDDGPGVDDHLHGGQEVGPLFDEEDGDPEQRHHEHQRGVHRIP